MKELIIISIVFNVILAISLFFKSAINNILEDWWKEKQAKRKEQISNLNLLKDIIDKLRRFYTIFFIEKYELRNESDEIQNLPSHKKHMETVEKIGHCLQSITTSEIHYPTDIRKMVRDFVNKYSARIDTFIDDPQKAFLKNYIEEIETDTSIIIRSIEKIIFK